MLNIETIFKLTPYSMRYRHSRYPTIKLHREAPILFRSVVSCLSVCNISQETVFRSVSISQMDSFGVGDCTLR